MDAITNAAGTVRLSELATAADVNARALGRAAHALRLACDRGDAAGIFTALRKLEAARATANLSAQSVISHAVSDHGYY